MRDKRTPTDVCGEAVSILVEFIIQPLLKNGTHFFCYESLSKGYIVLNEFMLQSHMRFCLKQWSATRFYSSLSVYSRPLPSELIAPWQPS